MTNATPMPQSTQKPRGPNALRRFVARLSPGGLAGLIMLIMVAALIAIVPLLPSFAPYKQNMMGVDLLPLQESRAGFHLFGTDNLGRDYLSRIAVGAGVSALIGISGILLALVVGVFLGLLAGYFRGWVETAIMGIADLQLAIPRILFLIAITAVVGPSILNLTLILGLTSWVAYGRVARALALSLREREFVLAARTHGAGPIWNIRKHLLPNVLPQMVIIATYELGQIIILEASLSFLGVGIQPPTPSLGMMVAEGQNYLRLNPWLAVIPGTVLFLMVAGAQFFSQSFTSEGRSGGFGGR